MLYSGLFRKLYPTISSVVEADFKTAEKIFIDKGADPEVVKRAFEEFKKLKPKIQDAEKKDIDLWAKGDFQKFLSFIDETKGTKSKNEVKKIQKSKGAELIAENEDWWVYRIKSHEAAVQYGANTKWCITSPSGAEWNNYSKDSDFYFIISKKERDDDFNKIALQYTTKGGKTYWDERDKNHGTLPPGLNVPAFSLEKPEVKIEINGKLYTESEFLAAKNLKVEGSLDLRDTPIESLPAGFSVGRDLWLNRTQIKSLPEGLSVGGSLDLSGTPIESLPEGFMVPGGTLYLENTPIKSLPTGLNVGGSLILRDSLIESLPQGLTVWGNLDLKNTPLKSLPEGLTVGSSLYIENTSIKSLPPDLKVGYTVYINKGVTIDNPSGLKIQEESYGDLRL